LNSLKIININCIGNLQKLPKVLNVFKRFVFGEICETGEITDEVVLGKRSVPLVTSRSLDVNLITALSLPLNSVLITSDALLLAGLKSWGRLIEVFLQGRDSAVPLALKVSVAMSAMYCEMCYKTLYCGEIRYTSV